MVGILVFDGPSVLLVCILTPTISHVESFPYEKSNLQQLLKEIFLFIFGLL